MVDMPLGWEPPAKGSAAFFSTDRNFAILNYSETGLTPLLHFYPN